jgi:hypothetical protein
MKKIKCCEYQTWDSFHNTLFSSQLMNGANKLELLHYIRLERLASDKHYILFGLFVSYEENKCCEYQTWHHIHNTLFSL